MQLKPEELHKDSYRAGLDAAAKLILTPIAQDIFVRVSALFAEVGLPTTGALTPGRNQHVVIGNGLLKPEGDPVVPFHLNVVGQTLDTVKSLFPHAAKQRLHWRRVPEAEGYTDDVFGPDGSVTFTAEPAVKITLRIGADDIEKEDNHG